MFGLFPNEDGRDTESLAGSAGSEVRNDPDEVCSGWVKVDLFKLSGTDAKYELELDQDATIGQLLWRLTPLVTPEMSTSLRTQPWSLVLLGSSPPRSFNLDDMYCRLTCCSPIREMVAAQEPIAFQLIRQMSAEPEEALSFAPSE